MAQRAPQARADAYAAAADDYSSLASPLGSGRPRRHRDPKSWNKRALSVFSVFFLIVGAIIIIVLVSKSGKDDKGDKAPGQATPPAPTSTSAADACASVAPHERTVAFWQSEVGGCEKIPDGVTHVVFGFALVDATRGVVVPTFQNTDDAIKTCVRGLQRRCIRCLGSIGGSTNNDALAAAADPEAFAASAVALVDKFGFDGIDVDDETVGGAFNATRVRARVEATRRALTARGPGLVLTYDAYFNEGETSFCRDPANAPHARCFPPELLASLDWLHIMAYNVHSDNATAAAIYDKALNTTFVEWGTRLGGRLDKAALGVCVRGSCAYGPGPSDAVIRAWNQFARGPGRGGMMVYAASGEAADDFPVTRRILPKAAATAGP